jgi:hypothetical protein
MYTIEGENILKPTKMMVKKVYEACAYLLGLL